MLGRVLRYLKQVRGLQRVNIALSRAAATSALRRLDERDPDSWVFSAFSQNGEDGILDVLVRRLRVPNRYFVEVGASDGLENNTTWLALGLRFGGLWIEGDRVASDYGRDLLQPLNYGVAMEQLFLTKERVPALARRLPFSNPDVFSLDVDGNDYHLVDALFTAGVRPKIFVVEYNSAFGPDRSVTIPYRADFSVTPGLGSNLYYGCSIAAWRKRFEQAGYRFITVEQNGVNAFFVDPTAFESIFLDNIRGHDYRPNTSHTREYGVDFVGQLARIADRPLIDV